MNGVFTTLQNLFRRKTERQANQQNNTNVNPESVQVPVQENQSSGKNKSLEAMTGRLAEAEAPDGKQFGVYEGPAVSTIRELAKVLAEAPDKTFVHHLSGDTNDFACWVRGVFADDLAAEKLKEVQNPSEIVYILDILSK